MPVAPLSTRQLAFIREYLVDRNGTQAAIRAGYAAGKGNGSAEVSSHRLLSDVRIASAIRTAEAAANHRVLEKLVVTKQRIAEGLDAIAFPVDPESVPTNVRRQALMDLGKLFGHIVEKREHRLVQGLSDLTEEEIAAIEVDLRRELAARKA